MPIKKDRIFAANKLLSENNMREIVNNKKIVVKKYFFRLITKKFIKPPKTFFILYMYKKIGYDKLFYFDENIIKG